MGNLQVVLLALMLLPAILMAESPVKGRAPQVEPDQVRQQPAIQDQTRSGSVKGAPFFGVKGRRPPTTPSTTPDPTTVLPTDPPLRDFQYQQPQQQQQQDQPLSQRRPGPQQQHQEQQHHHPQQQQQQQQDQPLTQRRPVPQQQQQQTYQQQQQQQQQTYQQQQQEQQAQYPQHFQLSEQERQEQIKKADEDLNKHLREALDELKRRMRRGMEEADYEVLDPLSLEDMNLKPIVAGEEFDVRMRKLTLGGLSGFDVTQLESQLSESRVKLGLYFPKLYANSLFDANGTMYDIFKVTGKGNATLIFNEVHARTVIYLSKENGTLQASSADQPYVDFSSAEILFRDDSVKGKEPVKAETVATQLGPLYFWVLTANAVEKIDYPLAVYLNKVLRDFALPQALQRMIFRQRYLRVHVPNHPIPYAYVSPELDMQPNSAVL